MKKLMFLMMLFGLMIVFNGNALAQGACPAKEPSETQIFVYTDADFGGTCVRIDKVGYQFANLDRLNLKNDTISSIKVGSKVRAMVCEHINYGGKCQSHLGNEGNMGNTYVGNDAISSIKALDKREIVEVPVSNTTDKPLIIFEAVGGVDSFLGTLPPGGSGTIYTDVNTSLGGKTEGAKAVKSNLVQITGSLNFILKDEGKGIKAYTRSTSGEG